MTEYNAPREEEIQAPSGIHLNPPPNGLSARSVKYTTKKADGDPSQLCLIPLYYSIIIFIPYFLIEAGYITKGNAGLLSFFMVVLSLGFLIRYITQAIRDIRSLPVSLNIATGTLMFLSALLIPPVYFGVRYIVTHSKLYLIFVSLIIYIGTILFNYSFFIFN